MSLPLIQTLVDDWVLRCFGPEQRSDSQVRALRVNEEAVEFAQSVGVDKALLHQLVDYVYDRPIGVPTQELGGVGITFVAACNALDADASEVIEAELRRILSKPTEHFTNRNKQKLEAGFA
jgi:NTP pyrophosphatase (non-canonical NTP hydrolase)